MIKMITPYQYSRSLSSQILMTSFTVESCMYKSFIIQKISLAILFYTNEIYTIYSILGQKLLIAYFVKKIYTVIHLDW